MITNLILVVLTSFSSIAFAKEVIPTDKLQEFCNEHGRRTARDGKCTIGVTDVYQFISADIGPLPYQILGSKLQNCVNAHFSAEDFLIPTKFGNLKAMTISESKLGSYLECVDSNKRDLSLLEPEGYEYCTSAHIMSRELGETGQVLNIQTLKEDSVSTCSLFTTDATFRLAWSVCITGKGAISNDGRFVVPLRSLSEFRSCVTEYINR